MALVELLQKSGDGDFLRTVAEAVLQILMEADVEGLIGAGRHERSAERLNYRNGYRERSPRHASYQAPWLMDFSRRQGS
jgi:putative transposase